MKKIHTAVRFTPQVLDRIERYGNALRKDLPGMEVTRADVISILVEKALTDLGYAPLPQKTKK